MLIQQAGQSIFDLKDIPKTSLLLVCDSLGGGNASWGDRVVSQFPPCVLFT